MGTLADRKTACVISGMTSRTILVLLLVGWLAGVARADVNATALIYYAFDDSNVLDSALDENGTLRGNNGTEVGTITYGAAAPAAGTSGGSVRLIDTGTSVVDIADAALVPFGGLNDKTITFWAQVVDDNNTDWHNWVGGSTADGGGGFYRSYIGYDDSGVGVGGTDKYNNSFGINAGDNMDGGAISDDYGAWRFWTIVSRPVTDVNGTLTGFSGEFYLDGNLAASDPSIGAFPGTSIDVNGTLTGTAASHNGFNIGSWNGGGGAGANGFMDDFVVWDKALSLTEIEDVRDNGPGISVIAPPESFTWTSAIPGAWLLGSNWTVGGPPNATNHTAVFGDAITQASTVLTDGGGVTVKAIEFDSAFSYAIAGPDAVTLEADTGNAGITVVQGLHEFQAVVNLNSETDVSVAAGAALAFNNALNLGANNLNKTGAGTMSINNALLGTGSVTVAAGAVGGSGSIEGDLNNESGTVTPGNSPGTLTVEGDYTQGSDATLLIELFGLAQGADYDLLDVLGTASFDGVLEIVLLDGFDPAEGDVFDILNFSAASGAFDSLQFAELSGGLAWDTSELYSAGSVAVVSAVPEPSTVTLFVLACSVMIFRRGSNRQQHH